MGGFYLLLPTLLTIFVSFLVVRAAAVALMFTGLDHRKAVFQALSAFSSTGFTTREAESVVNHPVRRRIVIWLMILGNAGFVTVIITASTSLVRSRVSTLPLLVLILGAGIFLIYKLATHSGFSRRWERIVEKRLAGNPAFDDDAVQDLLHFVEGHGLIRAVVTAGSPLAGTSVSSLISSIKGVVVLGIERGRAWLPSPAASEKIVGDDRLVIYGPLKELKSLLSCAENASECPVSPE